MNVMPIAWRNLRRNRFRSLISVVVMTVVSAVVVLLFSVVEGMHREIIYNVQTFTSGELKIENPEYEKNQMLNPVHLNIPDGAATLAWAEAQPECALAVPRIAFGGLVERDGRRHQVQGIGMDLARERAFSRLDRLVAAGRLPAPGAREAAVGVGLARSLGLGIGQRFSVLSTTRERARNQVDFTVVGLVDFPVAALSGTSFVTSLERAQSFLHLDGAVLQILAKAKPGSDLDAASERWNRVLAPQGLAASNWTRSSFMYVMVQVTGVIFGIVRVMFVLLGSAIIINTTMMVVFERRREIGTLGAMGMRPGELMLLFLAESLSLAGIGALVGTSLGSALTLWFAARGLDLSALMSGLNGEFPALLRPVLTVGNFVGSLALTVALSGLASLFPSWLATRVQPVEALRG